MLDPDLDEYREIGSGDLVESGELLGGERVRRSDGADAVSGLGRLDRADARPLGLLSALRLGEAVDHRAKLVLGDVGAEGLCSGL